MFVCVSKSEELLTVCVLAQIESIIPDVCYMILSFTMKTQTSQRPSKTIA